MICEKCNHMLQIGEFPFCPHDKQANGVIGDEIDVTIRHGMCHPDGTPQRFRSRAELRRAEHKAGMTNYVVHHEGSKHTSRWI